MVPTHHESYCSTACGMAIRRGTYASRSPGQEDVLVGWENVAADATYGPWGARSKTSHNSAALDAQGLFVIVTLHPGLLFQQSLRHGHCVHSQAKGIGLEVRCGKPDIMNTDQDSQFTSHTTRVFLKESGIRISMDGRGTWGDDIFIERF